jgi:hypothetical protein
VPQFEQTNETPTAGDASLPVGKAFMEGVLRRPVSLHV